MPAFWLTAMKNNEVLAEEVSSFGSAVDFFYNVHFATYFHFTSFLIVPLRKLDFRA